MKEEKDKELAHRHTVTPVNTLFPHKISRRTTWHQGTLLNRIKKIGRRMKEAKQKKTASQTDAKKSIRESEQKLLTRQQQAQH